MNFTLENPGGSFTERDPTNLYETVSKLSNVRFDDDFLVAIASTWTSIDVSAAGNTTPAIVANAKNGIVRCTLDSTSEAQESGLTWGNQEPIVLAQDPIFEARFSMHVIPTLLGICGIGLAGDKNAVLASVSPGIFFRVAAGGVLQINTVDGTHTNTAVTTGITLVADAFHVVRIDFTNPADVKFFVDGAAVATGTTFNVNATTTAVLQPYVHIAKASGAGLGAIDVDYIRVWQNRS